MKRINARQYKKLVKFCKEVFRKDKYISSRLFNLKIQQELSSMSTRYRRNMLSLQFIKEKNGLIFPGEALFFLKLIDYQNINRLMKLGEVIIIEKKIKYIQKPGITTLHNFPDHWKLESKSRGVLIFNVDYNL